ncbi:hypothetical protein GYB62_00235 [bacterium]|nr:hypothetical protein [bacterium]
MDFRLTTERPLSVAILSDLSDEIGLLQYLLKIAVGPDLQCQQYAVGMLSNLNLAKTHVILLDVNFGGRNYIHTLDELASQHSPLPPCIVLVDQREATGKLRDALRAGRLGVYDFLFKADLLVSSVCDALQEAWPHYLASQSSSH